MASYPVGKFETFEIGDNFENYIERLDQYLIFNEVEEGRKVSLFLTSIGSETYSTLKDLVSPEKPADKQYTELVAVLKSHLCPPKLVLAERFKFYSTFQEVGESIGNYIVRLKKLSNSCEFAGFLNEALRDRLICGLARADIQRKLLAEIKIDFKRACEIALSLELMEAQSKLMNIDKYMQEKRVIERSADRVAHVTNVNQYKPPREKGSENIKKKYYTECFRCGRKHSSENCPAKKWECFQCHKMGHTSVMCRSKKKIGQISEIESEDSDEKSEIRHIVEEIKNFKSGEEKGRQGPEYIQLEINNKKVTFEIDSGAGRSIMSLKDYEIFFPKLKLEGRKTQLRGVSGEKLKVMGSVWVQVRMNSKLKELQLIVTKSDIDFKPLMGRDWMDMLIPMWREALKVGKVCKTIEISKPGVAEQLREKYPNVFSKDRSRCIEGVTANLVLQDDVNPVFYKPYTVPYAIKQEIGSEIQQLKEAGILEPVRYSEWASPIVPVPRKNGGKIRLCVDCKVTLNPVLKTDQYPLPILEDIVQTITGGKYFTLLDLSNAYLQLKLNEESKKLVVINTHLGLFCFTRLPFGIACAPAQFQAAMDQILLGLPMTACFIDDVIIAGKTKQECLDNVERVLSRLNERNVRVNLEKCHFLCTEIEFLGHLLNEDGLKPLPAKLEAIRQAKAPVDLTQLRSYIGLINYYRKFVPMMATLLRPLYDLEKKGTVFVWSKECQMTFEKSKEALMNSSALVYYDQSKPIVITVDASPYGVGAVLHHVIKGEERPVMFASRSLSTAERGYAQIQKEALALVFAVKYFHKYIYGRRFTLVSDHKPLQAILGPKSHIPTLAAARLQRWAIILSAYEYKLEHRKGVDMAPADAMSRLPMETGEEITSDEVFVISEFQEPITALEVKKNSQSDFIVNLAMENTRKGWPDKVCEGLKPYFSRYRELTVEEGCLFWGSRLVIPYQLRCDVLDLLHNQHIGVVRMKMMARSEVWWPGMDGEIEQYVKRCEICQLNQRSVEPVPTVSWPRTTRNYQRIHIDFLQKDGKHFLLVVDSYSKWLDLYIMNGGTNAERTIEKLRSSFAIFGIPEEMVSDNGPPFNGSEYKGFCKSNGIKCTLSPPNHPKSNGFAEKQVSTIKRNLKKQLQDAEGKKTLKLQKMVDNFLFSYRNTPTTGTGLSPAEMILQRKPRTRLSLLKPLEDKGKECAQKSTKVRGVNITKKPKGKMVRRFYEGQRVLCYFVKNKPQWKKGKIAKILSPVTYLVVVEGLVRFLHADHIRDSHLEGIEKENEMTGILSGTVDVPGREAEDEKATSQKDEALHLENKEADGISRADENTEMEGTLGKEDIADEAQEGTIENEEKKGELRRSQRKVSPPKRLIDM